MDLFEQRKIYTVGEITSDIKKTLEKFGLVWIQGEVSNFKHAASGHMYFSLKDEAAQIRAAFFKGSNLYLKFKPADGLEVVVRGRLSVYAPRGDYQLIVEYMEPVGVGSLQLAFEQLKEKLRKEGLFDEERKRRLPVLPRKIGIVTSPTGAAIRDMLRILERRNSALHVLLYPARVQGAEAASEIVAGIRHLNARDDIDVIIVGRGGGSIEDLWAFNDEGVARAIFESAIPVISAVGHEVDFTIADFVADLRAPTPSAAAEQVSGAREQLQAEVQSLAGRAKQAVRLILEKRRLHLQRLAQNRAFLATPTRIQELQQRFDEASLKMMQAMRRFVTQVRHRERVLVTRLVKIDLRGSVGRSREILKGMRQALAAAMRLRLQRVRGALQLGVGRMDAMSPLAILERGYSICRDAGGAILKQAAAVAPGEQVSVKLARGEIGCRVESTTQEGEA